MIFFHAGFPYFQGGFVGIDIFFVISGYLITSIIVADLERDRFSITEFYERRARRILPALYLVLFACLPFAWAWLLPEYLRAFSQSLVAAATFTANIYFYLTSGYFSGAAELKPLLHSWSLAVEEQFYLVYPLLLIFLFRYAQRHVLSALAALLVSSLALAEFAGGRFPSFDYFLLPTRFWELLVGALCAFYLRRGAAGFSNGIVAQCAASLGLALIAISVVTFEGGMPYPGLYALVPTVGTALVIIAARPANIAGRLLTFRPLVGVGLISYSAYLWHQPLFSFAHHRSVERPSVAMLVGLTVASLGLAVLSWRYVERPFRNRGWLSRRQVFCWAAGGLSFFLAIGLIGHFSDGFRDRLPSEALKIQEMEKTWALRVESQCDFRQRRGARYGCVMGERAATPRTALVGDSHAFAISEELARAFAARDRSFVSLAKPGCRLNFYMEEVGIAAGTHDCAAHQQRIADGLADDDLNTYIILVRRHWADDELGRSHPGMLSEQSAAATLAAHIRSIEAILTAGKRVVLIYPIPTHRTHISNFMIKNWWYHDGRLAAPSASYPRFRDNIRRYRTAYDALGNAAALKRVYPDRLFCGTVHADRCVSQIDGEILYLDPSHVSNSGARLIVGQIMNYLDSDNTQHAD